MKITAIAHVAVVLTIAFVSGCTVFPDHEPPRVMEIAVPGPAQVTDQRFSQALRVDTPYASDPFNSSRILAKPNRWEFRAYPSVRWRDTMPVLVRDTLVGTLRSSGAFGGVITDTSPAPAELTLISELSAFHTENLEGETARVVIELHAQLLENRSRTSLCKQSFRIVEPAAGSGIEQAVEAFGAAGNRLSDQIIDWVTGCGLPSRQEKDQPRQL
ncbi:MAG: membrane integrity-associated transporter subunit PqiC [Marinobacter sp.]|nr:membrane integrity-associated transporter subunit PqiC [Marinobacter sp.]